MAKVHFTSDGKMVTWGKLPVKEDKSLGGKIAVAIQARKDMREARRGKPISFSWPRWGGGRR